MRPLFIVFVLLLLLAQPASALPVPIPPYTQAPNDLDDDGKYEDLNGNGRADFADVVALFNQMTWISVNEPVPTFDYNGNGRIDFADVVVLFNELGSGPAPTPTVTGDVLVSQQIDPSPQDRTITTGGMTLMIPGGVLDQTSVLRIATVPRPPTPPTGTDRLTVYDITIGNQARFRQALSLEIPYDPTAIPAGVDPSDAIRGISWDAASGTWRDLPTAVDTVRHVVVLAPSHLCVAGYTVDLRPTITEISSAHFVVHFDPEDNAAIAEAWRLNGGSFTSAEQMAYGVMADLEDAYFRYTHPYYDKNGTPLAFKPPVASDFKYDNKVHVYLGNYYSSEWSWKSRCIYVAESPFNPGVPDARKNLKMELGHEVFHAVQNAYVTRAWMMANRWWMDATAEYASTYYFMGKASTQYPIDLAFFDKPLTTTNSFHEYQTAHVLDNVLSYAGDGAFSLLWEKSISSFSVYDGLVSWCKDNQYPLEKAYASCMIYSLILNEPGGKLNQTIGNNAVEVEMSDVSTTLPGFGTGIVSPAYTTYTDEQYETWFEAWGGKDALLPEGCSIWRININQDGTGSFYVPQDLRRFAPWSDNVPHGAKQVFAIVNVGKGLQTIDLAVTRPEAHLDPESKEIVRGVSVTFTPTVSNIPFGMHIRLLDQKTYGVVSEADAADDGTATLPPITKRYPDTGNYQMWLTVEVGGIQNMAWDMFSQIHVVDPPP